MSCDRLVMSCDMLVMSCDMLMVYAYLPWCSIRGDWFRRRYGGGWCWFTATWLGDLGCPGPVRPRGAWQPLYLTRPLVCQTICGIKKSFVATALLIGWQQ